MAVVLDYFTRINSVASDYPAWLFWVSIVIVLILTEFIKLPIKHFTDKIENEDVRKKVNSVIMLIPIAFGFAISWILTYFGFKFSTVISLVWGVTSIAIYEFISRIMKRIKKGEVITTETIATDIKESFSVAETADSKFKELVGKINNNTTNNNEKKN